MSCRDSDLARPENDRACDRRRIAARRRNADRIARGVCTRCGENPAEPDRRLCGPCLEIRRAADRERYAKAKAAGLRYGGRSVAAKRRSARDATKKRQQERREAGLCIRCGRRPPVAGGSSCAPCRKKRQAAEREQYAARRAAGLCTRCNGPVTDGGSRCARCLALDDESGRTDKKNAQSRKRYRERRAAGRCPDCNRPSGGAVLCEACTKRAQDGSAWYRGIPTWNPAFTVIELATGETHGPFDSEGEAIASLSFTGLSLEEVEIVNDAPLSARVAGWA